MNPRRKILALMVVPALVFLLCSTAYALTINLNPLFDTGAEPGAWSAYQAAAAQWENEFTDPVTVNIDVGLGSLGPGIVGGTLNENARYGYVATRNALVSDATSSADTAANARLQMGADFDVLINRTFQNSGSGTPYLFEGVAADANLYYSNANAKALGLLAANAPGLDATITLDNTFITWDYDQSDGITLMQRDFTGVAAHEMAHALGFVSGVDILDDNANDGNFFNDSAYVNGFSVGGEDLAVIRAIDLFRVSADSETEGVGVLDFTADNRPKYYISTNGNDQFSRGVNFGNGQQASHWLTESVGLLGPTSTDGILYMIQANDVEMLDVIGWNIDGGGNGPQVPEPGTMLLLGTGLIGLAAFRRKFKN